MIYVSGATGVTGSEVVRLLRAEGAPVRGLAHHPEAAETLENLGAEVTLGDLRRPQTLTAGLEGVEALFVLCPPDPELAEMEGNLVEAAAAAGVRRVVKQSCSGVAADSPMVIGRAHAESERQVQASGMAFTLLRPNGFMQNMLQNAPMIAVAGMIYAPMGDGQVSFVDARDIAAVASRALLDEGHEGAVYDVTGPEALSNFDVADKISAAIGKPITYAEVPAEESRSGMIEMGLPEWFADDLITLFEIYREGRLAGVTDDVSKVTGRPATTYDEFVRDHAAVFQGQAAA